jgi:hypothetical protein
MGKYLQKTGKPQDLPESNVDSGRVRDYTSYYTDRTDRIVAGRFAVDIEFFGYGFGY